MWSPLQQLVGQSVRRRACSNCSSSSSSLRLRVNIGALSVAALPRPGDSRVPGTNTHACFSSKASSSTAVKKKKRPSFQGVRADEGRVVMVQSSGKLKNNKSKTPKLCTGCGTEVLFGQDVGVAAGMDAVNAERSKKMQKKSRFVDAMDGQEYSHKQGEVQTGFLCDRCKHLRSNNVWKAYDALNDVDAEVFAKQLSYVVHRRQFGMCVLVVDATDPEHSAMKGLRKSIGKTPCWLVFNKIDLLPRFHDGDMRTLRGRVEKIVGTKFANCTAVSAIREHGIIDLAEQLLLNLGGRDIFVVGAANVGKTTLVQCLSACIANAVKLVGKSYQKRRDIANHLAATGSHLPGTTLQAIRIPCFRKPGHALWDTPGIINKKAVQYSIFPTHLMEPMSRPLAIPMPDDLRKGRIRPGYSILIEAGWMHKSFLENPDTYRNLMKFRRAKGDRDPSRGIDEGEIEEELDPDADLFEGWDEEAGEDGDNGDDKTKQRRSLPRREQRPLAYERSNPTGPDDSFGSPTVLGRIDVTQAYDQYVYLQAYLHPTLNVRIVPTRDAPDRAIIPKDYIRYVEGKMGRSIKSDSSVEKRLMAHKHPEQPNGEIRPTEKDANINSGKVFIDISFASLGWLAIAHGNTDFTLIPHCVEGSVYSKRRSLYPLNLQDVSEQDPFRAIERDDLDSEQTKQRLRSAADEGKRAQGGSGNRETRRPDAGSYDDDGGHYENDDEWF